MNQSKKKAIWNKRKGEPLNIEKELENEDLTDQDGREMDEMIWQVQQRFGVSREEARNIIRNSELI